MRRLIRAVPLLLLVACAAALFAPRGAETLPLFASRTGLQCQTCHFDPNGGGPRNEFGFAFAKNRHSLEPDTTGEWADLNLANRVSETVPVYFGLNHRIMLIANAATQDDSLDRFGFFNMEGAIHLAFQPHRRLALVHTRDGGSFGTIPRESFGWIGGFPFDGYIKVGAFRNPFGERMDDHTVATRNGYLDFYLQSPQIFPYSSFIRSSYLPYDPRATDTGVELGGTSGSFYGRLAYTNGATHPIFSTNTFAETKAIKLGYVSAWYRGALSFYDQFQKEGLSLVRSTRWAYSGSFSRQAFVLLGEIGAGTDEWADGSRINNLAGFAELNWHPTRALNFRGRYDYMNLDRDDTPVPGSVVPLTRTELNTHSRYALEGEVLPMPFAELRWTLRWIDHRADQDPLGLDIEDEKQAYVQMHFSY